MPRISTKWTEYCDLLEYEAQKVDPAVRLVTKNSWFWQLIATILSFFMIMDKKTFLEGYATTIGPIQAYPENWPYWEVEQLIAHESRHTRQFRWFGLGIHPWVGLVPMALFYLLFPLPVFVGWVRYRLELDAAASEWWYMLNHGATKPEVIMRALHFAELIASPAYGYAVPFKWARWGFMRKVDKVIKAFEAYSWRFGI